MIQSQQLYASLQQEASPLASARQSLQQYIKSLKSDLTKLPELPHNFAAHPSAKNRCTKILSKGQKYFHCDQCSQDRKIDKMIYCGSCFDAKLHEGHKIQQKQVGNNGQASCDCGRKLRVKESSICEQHRGTQAKIIELKEEDVKEFIQYWTELFKIWVYLVDKKQKNQALLLDLVIDTLVSLCQDSLYYCRMVTKFLECEVTVSQKPTKISDILLDQNSFLKLLLQLAGDEQFMLTFGEYFANKQISSGFNYFQFGLFRDQLFDCQSFLFYMSKKGIFFTSAISNYFRVIQKFQQQQKTAFITEMLNKFSNQLQPCEYIEIVFKLLKEEDGVLLGSDNFTNCVLEKILNYFKSKGNGEKGVEGKEEKQAQEEKQKKQKIQKAERQLMVKKSLNVFSLIFNKKCVKGILSLQNVIQKLYSQQGQRRQNLQNFTDAMMSTNFIKDIMKQRHANLYILGLYLIDKHSKKGDLILKFWNLFMPASQSFPDNLDGIYKVISTLANSYRVYPALGVSQQQWSQSKESELKQKLFKSYLFEKKQISKKPLWTEHNSGWLKFKNCGRILNSLCEYVDARDTFVYKSKQQFPNLITKIPVDPGNNWQAIKNLNIDTNTPSFCQSQTLSKIILILFQTEHFYNLLQQNFIKGLQSVQKQARNLDKWKKKGVGEIYVLVLLLIDKLCHGKQYKELIEQITKIQLNIDQYRFRFTEIGNQQKIKKMLCVDALQKPLQGQVKQNEQQGQKKQQKKEPTKQQLKNQQMLKKAELKRQKLQGKYKKKRGDMLQVLKKDKTSVNQQQQQETVCLSCKQHEKKGKDQQFINLIHISKQKPISKILHGDQSKTSIKLSTNLHTIHLKHFKQGKKKQLNFQCPLCKQSTNCFLPYRPNRATENTWLMSWNVVNAVQVYNGMYETQCLFEVLLDGLVQSLGFSELVLSHKTKTAVRFKNKVDCYLIQTLSCLYSFSSKAQKQKYTQIYNKLRQKIKTCTKKQLQLFQLVILEAVYFRVTGQIQIDTSLIQQLSRYMIEDQLKTLRNTLQFITQGNSDVISSLDQISMQRIQQYQNESQEKIPQQPTSLQKLPEIQPTTATEQVPKQQQGAKIVSKSQIPVRSTLGINILKVPRKLSELKSTFLKILSNPVKCSGCQSQSQAIDSVCLICKRLFCQKCRQDEYHEELHLGNYILIDMDTAQLSSHKNSKSDTTNIYFNDFMIEYKKNRNDDDDDEESQKQEDLVTFMASKAKKNKKKEKQDVEYYLAANKFAEVVEKFYNLVNL